MSIRTGSRFVRTTLVRQLDVSGNPTQPDFLDLEPVIERTDFDDNKNIQVTPSDGWASLGLKYLHDARAWWAIAAFSRVVDPFEELTPGTLLVAPSQTVYHFTLVETPE